MLHPFFLCFPPLLLTSISNHIAPYVHHIPASSSIPKITADSNPHFSCWNYFNRLLTGILFSNVFPFGLIIYRVLRLFSLNCKYHFGASLMRIITCIHFGCRITSHTCSSFSIPYQWIQSPWTPSLSIHLLKKFGSLSWVLYLLHSLYPIGHLSWWFPLLIIFGVHCLLSPSPATIIFCLSYFSSIQLFLFTFSSQTILSPKSDLLKSKPDTSFPSDNPSESFHCTQNKV